MCKLITNNPRKRLKRTNFTASAQQIHKSLELPDLRPDTPLQSSIDWPPWNQQSQIEIVKDIDGVTSKMSMIKRELLCLTRNMLDKKNPSNYWIRAFTDGSASEAVRDGAGLSPAPCIEFITIDHHWGQHKMFRLCMISWAVLAARAYRHRGPPNLPHAPTTTFPQ
ncbi:hypothetical protein ElyMa_001997900 [Elysia marginata]|uniref:Reverse transcriptase domain-containing protein n=1 Tax=Elysia marginata TaxID=1093978 RepID=A0AAV4F4V8_9GAST|nr:hypothetical protein ElyMa_001997900 [Elysia marginata]